MNKVILMGRLTREPDIRYSNSGDRQLAIARFTLAVDRRRSSGNNSENTADFIQCVAFDRQAEFAEKYLHQGTKIAMTGRIQTGSYTNKDGQRVYTTDVVVEEMEFAESKAAAERNNSGSGYRNDNYNNNYNSNYGGGYQQAAPSSRPDPSNALSDGFMNIPDGVEDEHLPFN
ncbi:MAG: single-stranded DNA-binding protein [Lachnospiraceae bacterium]